MKTSLPAAFLLSLATAVAAGSAQPGVATQAVQRGAEQLSGRWNIVFDMPQGSYETPIEFLAAPNGTVTATVLGPLGNFRISDTAGSLKGNRVTLQANTTYGKLKMDAVLEGDRMRGQWAPAGFVARLFFKGQMRGLRDRKYVPGSRAAAFDAAWLHLERDFYAPDYNGVELQSLRQRYRARAAAAETDGAFLSVMRQMLGEFRTSHLEFFATPSWTQELHPPEPPAAKPVEATEGITWKQAAPSVGYLRIESFEDGPKVVSRVDRAFSELSQYPSLVIDLRGNGGGSLSAAMRLGDYILPRAEPVGYFASRHGLAKLGARSIDQIRASALPVFTGYNSEDFSREMSSAGALMLQTGGRTERSYKGRIVVLIDEYCFSASEALASVAKETRAATLIGRRTPGAMLAAVPMAVEGGWMLLLPVWDFRTPRGVKVEGRGIEPDIAVRFRDGRDADLAAALKYLKTPLRRD